MKMSKEKITKLNAKIYVFINGIIAIVWITLMVQFIRFLNFIIHVSTEKFSAKLCFLGILFFIIGIYVILFYIPKQLSHFDKLSDKYFDKLQLKKVYEDDKK